jgi:uncharacterized membrane protein (TIGR02234 family)
MCLLLLLAGAGLVLLAASRTWVTAVADGGLARASEVGVSGGTASAGVPALALVALAGAVVLMIGGRALRLGVAVLLLLAGVGVMALVLGVAADPGSAVRSAVSAATGTQGGTGARDVRTTGWLWPAGAGGLLLVAGGGSALATGRSWPGASARYERTGAAGADPDPNAPAGEASAWDALSRGDDPTA